MLTCPEGGVVRSVNRPIAKKYCVLWHLHIMPKQSFKQTAIIEYDLFFSEEPVCCSTYCLNKPLSSTCSSFTFDRSPPLSFAGLCPAAPWNPESAEALRCRCSCADYREADGQRVVACANPPSPVLLSGIRVDLSKHSLYALFMHVHVPVATCINHRQPNRNMTAPHAI